MLFTTRFSPFRRAVLFSGIAVIALPVSADCWRKQQIGRACDFGACDPVDKCSLGINMLENEDVFIAISDGNREENDLSYSVCWQSWTVRDPQDGSCDYYADCSNVVSSRNVHGQLCLTPPGGS